METSSSSAPTSRRGAAPQAGRADWRTGDPGIIDRMRAYRDWWNIPDGHGRRGPAKKRTRPANSP